MEINGKKRPGSADSYRKLLQTISRPSFQPTFESFSGKKIDLKLNVKNEILRTGLASSQDKHIRVM